SRTERKGHVRLKFEARHVIRAVGIEAAADPGIGGPADGKRVLPEQMVGLTDHRIKESTAIELGRILHAGVQPAAALDAIPTGILVDLEKVAGVEIEVLGILI